MTAAVCPACNSLLPAGAPEGLCPKCLLGGVIGSASPVTQPFAAASRHGFVPPTPAELAALFPQFEILELLGRGGMGAVYKARQPALDRLVALKILPAEMAGDPSFADRFLREARYLARLSHPNIVGLYDVAQSGGLLYFVMEYVDGVNLRAALQEKRLAPREALAVVGQICDALQYAHDEGIVHRDVKPENILLDRRGRVKIADFGLAKLVESPEDDLTRTHQVLGTVRYMAPEQLEGSRHVDHRADIYSLGVVFYEILTGEVPMGRFAPPSKKAEVDARLDDVVLRALEREPAERYQHASDVKSDVESITSSVAIKPVPRVGGAPELFRQRISPRDGTDLLLILVLAPVILLLFFVVPFYVTGFALAGLGMRGDEQIMPLALLAGCGVLITTFVVLGLGSVQALSLDARGLTLHRYAGPSQPLTWDDVARVEEISRWQALWEVGFWPGIPPRGSIIGMSTKHYFRIDSNQGSWYFCPDDAREFVASVERYSGGKVASSAAIVAPESPIPPTPIAAARSSTGWGWAIVVLVLGCLLVLPCCLVGAIAASFMVLVEREPTHHASEPTAEVSRDVFTSARKGDLDYVREQLAHGLDPTRKDSESRPLLVNAAIGGHAGVVKEILAAGAMVDDRDADERTALMMAASYGHLSAVNVLLVEGASLKSRDRSGKTALDWAATRDRTSIEELLLSEGAEATGTYLAAKSHKLIAAGKSSEALPLLSEALALEPLPASDWWYEFNQWQHRIPRPTPYLHALALEAAQLADNEEEGKKHVAALARFKDLSGRTLYYTMWLSPQARATNEPDPTNYIHEEFVVEPEALAATVADWRKPLRLRFQQNKVSSSGRGGSETKQSGHVTGIVRGLREAR